MMCTRIAFVDPGIPGGEPATIIIASPLFTRCSFMRIASTCLTISSVVCTRGVIKGSIPQENLEDVMKVGDKVHVEIGEIDPKGKLSLVPVLEETASE